MLENLITMTTQPLKFFAAFVLIILLTTSCEKVFFQPEPEVNNLTIFDDFSKIYNEKYAMFELKQVDWQPLSDSVRATIAGTTTQQALADKMGYMVARLRDGHSSLSTPLGEYGFDLLEGYDINLDTAAFNAGVYLRDDNRNYADQMIATVLRDNVGYLLIEGFDGFTKDDIVDALDYLKDTRGLVIDVRTNGGGDPELAGELARRFTTTAYEAGVEKFKSGPGANDFSSSDISVNPATEGATYVDKPIVILQGRLSYSATTTLIYLTDPNPNVTTMGGLSGGGTGSVASGYLLNGWSYNLSVSDFIDARGRRLDDGVAPDIEVVLDLEDTAQDEIIEAATDFILN